MKRSFFYCCLGFYLLHAQTLLGQSDCACETFSKGVQQKFEQENLKQRIEEAFATINSIKENKAPCCQAIAHAMESILLNTIGKANASFDNFAAPILSARFAIGRPPRRQ